MYEPLINQEIEKTLALLAKLAEDAVALAKLPNEKRVELLKLAGQLSRPDKEEILKRHKAKLALKRQAVLGRDKSIRSVTGIRKGRQEQVFVAPPRELPTGVKKILGNPRNCYVCKISFTELHDFYDSMCRLCGDFNYAKRFQTVSLEGRVALITGARLKIGYQATLMMLRAGARVIVTTRFPVDAASRFSKESDFKFWSTRLQIYGLDLRHIPSVEIFSRHICSSEKQLDILINNAAQTVRRPPGFYSHLMETELTPFTQLPPDVRDLLKMREVFNEKLQFLGSKRQGAIVSCSPVATWQSDSAAIGLTDSARLSQIPYSFDGSLSAEEVFPQGKLDADLQQTDLRKMNSWRLKIGDTPTLELLEVQLVNSIAPFVLCSKLLPLMRKDNTQQKHIVNVTAMEGKFSRYTKTECHPHTNMAKAALNMMTHTSAKELARDGIFMNAVDTGWVTDEDPVDFSTMKQELHDFHPPLDIVDGAARICDPFFSGVISGVHWSGKFLKDYHPTEW